MHFARAGRDPRPPRFWLAVVLIACAGPAGEESSHPGAPPGSATAAGTVELTLLTYNVWHGYWRGEASDVLRLPAEPAGDRARRLEDQLHLLGELRPDVLLLQELGDLPRLARRYARALGYDEVHQVQDCGLKVFGIGIPLNVHGGLAILARRELRLERLRAVKLSGPPLSLCADRIGLQLGEVRYALLAAVTLEDGRRLLLANTHLHAAARRTPTLEDGLAALLASGRLAPQQAAEIEQRVAAAERRRRQEIGRLLEAMESERRGGGYAAAILGGDLNAAPGSPVLEELAAAGFVAARPGDGAGLATHDPAANPLAAALGRRSRRELPDFGVAELAALLAGVDREPAQIDHLLVSGLPPGALRRPRLFATAAPAAAAAPDDPAASLPRFPSDHFGLVVRLQVQAGPAR